MPANLSNAILQLELTQMTLQRDRLLLENMELKEQNRVLQEENKKVSWATRLEAVLQELKLAQREREAEARREYPSHIIGRVHLGRKQ